MLPVLLDLKFIKIYTFGVFLVLAFFWSSFLLWKNIRLTSYKEEEVFDALFLSLTGALFFSRLFYILLNFSKFGFSISKFILINGYPGLSLFGALFGGFIISIIYFSYKKVSYKEISDYFVSSIFVALGFGKLGSFFSGTEVGTKTNILLAIKYVGYDGFRHLTPFYEAILFFAGAYISYKLLFNVRRERLSHGIVFIFLIWFINATYFVFDKFKTNKLYLAGLSFNGTVSIILLLTFSIYFLYYFKNPIISKLGLISNYLKHYGQKAWKKINISSKAKAGTRESKNSSSD